MRICKTPSTETSVHLGRMYILTIITFKHIDYGGVVKNLKQSNLGN